MQETATVARPYAQAAFEHARGSGQGSEWSEGLAYLAALFSDPILRGLVHDPRIGRPRLTELIFDLAGERLTPDLRNFVRVLLDADRILIVPEIARLFAALVAEAAGMAEVEVISAFALEEGQQLAIARAVRRRAGKDIEVKTRIDPALIGGAVIRMGDLVIDASVRGRLQQLASQFA
ncbi:MAG: F0F1 ATP synthase subunit delta [Gammaproteobacteria bacterium]